MESEKVKEIKKALEYAIQVGLDKFSLGASLSDCLTLINELEKENKKLLDSVESVQNDRCVYKCELTKKHLKQFAEMLKEKAIVFFDEGEPIVLTSNIDETLIETTEGV